MKTFNDIKEGDCLFLVLGSDFDATIERLNIKKLERDEQNDLIIYFDDEEKYLINHMQLPLTSNLDHFYTTKEEAVKYLESVFRKNKLWIEYLLTAYQEKLNKLYSELMKWKS